MKTAIRKRAFELGFDDCRFTTADPPDHAVRLQRWLSEDRHGEMVYLGRTADKRLNPQYVLPGARSIITLATSYHVANWQSPGAGASSTRPAADPGGQSTPRNAISGLVARYARFQDYHRIIGESLKRLSAYVDEVGGAAASSLWYVDTGPLLERDLAQRAGLGFIGKHTNLISRRSGNWMFLSEIISTLELEPDVPQENRCGTCARCLAACPTGAIIAPFELDARKCISYLTIELKGSIPIQFRPAIGNRIFGCDDCLAVCPWNRFAREGRAMRDQARPELAQPELADLLGLDEIAFKQRFAGTPILRAKRRGLLRNVCVALGNIGDAAALPALQMAASDAEPLVAEHARWAIDQIRTRSKPKR